MKKFLFVMNIPSPYRIHLLTEVWRQLDILGIEMHVHFMAKGHADRPKSWLNPKIDFPHTYWPDWGFGEFHFNPGLVFLILKNPPDYLVCGSSFDTFTGVLIQLFSRAKVKMCWLEGNTKTPGRLGGLVGWFKRLVMGKCRFAPVPGSDAAKYIGLHQQRTKKAMPKPVCLPNLVDESRFAPKAEICRANSVSHMRVCIIPARLEPVKGLIPFFRLLTPDMLAGWQVKLLGQGSLKNEIKCVLTQGKLTPFVEIIDYIPYDEMPQRYREADLLLLPSVYDPNPLSVIEALHCGLAVAISNMAGNVEEAVTEDVNGWVLPVMDSLAFRSKLRRIFSTPKDRLLEMGRASHIQNAQFWNTKDSVRRFLNTVLS